MSDAKIARVRHPAFSPRVAHRDNNNVDNQSQRHHHCQRHIGWRSTLDLRDLIDRLGGYRVVARAVRLRPSAIRSWVNAEYVPPKHHEKLKAMAAEAGISVETKDLDPMAAEAPEAA